MSRVCVSTELSSNGAVISIGLRFVAITNMNAKYFFATNWLIRFRVSRRRREMYFGYARLRVCVCVSVCLSAAACLHYCTDPNVTCGSGRGCPYKPRHPLGDALVYSCALLGGFAIDARVALLWQHNANAKY